MSKHNNRKISRAANVDFRLKKLLLENFNSKADSFEKSMDFLLLVLSRRKD